MSSVPAHPVPLDFTLECSKVQMTGLEIIGRETLATFASKEPMPYLEFLGLGQDAVIENIALYRKEVEWSTMLILLATIEAIIRLDYKKKRRKVGQFRALYSTFGVRTPLKAILDIWITEKPLEQDVFRQYKEALRLRNWLAHGRYFHHNVGRSEYSIDYIYEVGIQIQNILD